MSYRFVIVSSLEQAYDKSMVDLTINSIKSVCDTQLDELLVIDTEGNQVSYSGALSLISPGKNISDVILKAYEFGSMDRDHYIFVDPGFKFEASNLEDINKKIESENPNLIKFEGGYVVHNINDLSGIDTWGDLLTKTKKKKSEIKETPVIKPNIPSFSVPKDPAQTPFNKYFDEVYCINLSRDQERWENMQKVLMAIDIKAKRWTATTDSLFRGYSFILADDIMHSRYLACLNSHLSAMEDALARGYERIFIIEDDIVPVKDFHSRFESLLADLPSFWDMIYLSYIRTNDDKSMWTYKGIEEQKLGDSLVYAKNFWSGMAYGLSRSMMERIVNWYRSNPPIEIDRFYVEKVQISELFYTYGALPQMFAGVDNYSNNTQINEKIFDRSINSKYQNRNSFIFPEDIPDIIHPNNYFDGIFCINLLESKDRWNYVSKKFDALGLNVTQFNAVNDKDGSVVRKYKKIKDTVAPTRDPNANIKTLAAFTSHMRLIKHCIDNEYERILIFEDDVVFRKDFLIEFTHAVNNYPDNTDVWMLGAFQYDWGSTITINDKFYETSNSLGLFAYALTLEGAKKLYNKLEELVDLNWSIDLAIRDGIMNKGELTFRVSWPFLVGHDIVVSTTRNETFDFTNMFPRNDFNYLD